MKGFEMTGFKEGKEFEKKSFSAHPREYIHSNLVTFIVVFYDFLQ